VVSQVERRVAELLRTHGEGRPIIGPLRII
jgi:hypothetical protein